MAVYDRILVSIDGTEAQWPVIERGMELARTHEAHLCFAYVAAYTAAQEATLNNMELVAQEFEARMREDLADVLERARTDKYIKSATLSVSAGAVIDALFDRLIPGFKPDLIVCGKRGLSKIKYAFLGSVSSALVRNSDCDVLVLN